MKSSEAMSTRSGDICETSYIFKRFGPVIHRKPQTHVTKNQLFWKLRFHVNGWKQSFLFSTVTACDEKIHSRHIYVTFVYGRYKHGERERCRRVRFSCVLLSSNSKTTFKNNSASLSVQTSDHGATFNSLEEETEWWGLILIRWHGIQVWKTPPPMGLAWLEPHLSVDLSSYVWTIFLFINDQVWIKVFFKTNEVGCWFLEIPGCVCTRL